jgi:hypothetical protein
MPVAAEEGSIDILIFLPRDLVGGRHGAPLAQGAAGAIPEKRKEEVKSEVANGDTETELLSQAKKGRAPLVDEVNGGCSPWSTARNRYGATRFLWSTGTNGERLRRGEECV